MKEVVFLYLDINGKVTIKNVIYIYFICTSGEICSDFSVALLSVHLQFVVQMKQYYTTILLNGCSISTARPQFRQLLVWFPW